VVSTCLAPDDVSDRIPLALTPMVLSAPIMESTPDAGSSTSKSTLAVGWRSSWPRILALSSSFRRRSRSRAPSTARSSSCRPVDDCGVRFDDQHTHKHTGSVDCFKKQGARRRSTDLGPGGDHGVEVGVALAELLPALPLPHHVPEPAAALHHGARLPPLAPLVLLLPAHDPPGAFIPALPCPAPAAITSCPGTSPSPRNAPPFGSTTNGDALSKQNGSSGDAPCG
jgi:hypothetical protein